MPYKYIFKSIQVRSDSEQVSCVRQEQNFIFLVTFSLLAENLLLGFKLFENSAMRFPTFSFINISFSNQMCFNILSKSNLVL